MGNCNNLVAYCDQSLFYSNLLLGHDRLAIEVRGSTPSCGLSAEELSPARNTLWTG